MSEIKIMRRPAIKSGIGIWNYYVSSMSFEQISNFVKMPEEIYKSKKLSDMIQRSVTENIKSIVEYINVEDERFFNSLVLAVYNGEPKWYEGVFEYDDELFYNIGVLEFRSDVRIFPVDGQHRVAAIKEIVRNGDERTNQEEVPVIFIAHCNDEEGIKRTRRLFTTLNRYAKPVKLNEIIALDEDDIVAVITRRLVEEFELFPDDKININKTESIPDNDQKSFMNIITLYKCNDLLLKCYLKREGITEKPSKYKRYKKENEIVNVFYNYVCDFWELFMKYNVDVKNFFETSENEVEVRGKQGGNLLFRPVGIKAYLEAVSEIYIKQNQNFEDIFKVLTKVNLQLNQRPWKGVLWDGHMKTDNRPLVKKLLIYIYNPAAFSTKQKMDLLQRYADIIGIDVQDNLEDLLDDLIISDEL